MIRKLREWYWRRWEAKHVIRYASGKTVVVGAGQSELLRWYKRQNWRCEQ